MRYLPLMTMTWQQMKHCQYCKLRFGTGIRMREFCCCTKNNANDRFITYIYNKETNKDVTKLDCIKLLMKMSVRHKMSLYVICTSNLAIRHAHSDMQWGVRPEISLYVNDVISITKTIILFFWCYVKYISYQVSFLLKKLDRICYKRAKLLRQS